MYFDRCVPFCGMGLRVSFHGGTNRPPSCHMSPYFCRRIPTTVEGSAESTKGIHVSNHSSPCEVLISGPHKCFERRSGIVRAMPFSKLHFCWFLLGCFSKKKAAIMEKGFSAGTCDIVLSSMGQSRISTCIGHTYLALHSWTIRWMDNEFHHLKLSCK